MFLENAREFSEQLPCRSAEVKFFSVFLCQSCREIWREILVKFSVLRFPRFGCATENFTKISRQKRCEKWKISRKFHSASRGRKRHINIWHINNFSVTPVTDPPGREPDSSRPGARTKMFMFLGFRPQHINFWPLPTGRETPPPHRTPPPGQSPEKFVYVYVPFPFLS